MRYFDDKAVDPPKRKTRGEEIAESLADAMPIILFAARKEDVCYCTENYTCDLHEGDDEGDDKQDKTPDIHEPVHAKSDNGLCDICGYGRDSDRHHRRDGRIGDEGTGE